MRGRGHRAGRAARNRRQKRESAVQSVSMCHQLPYVRLMKFLRRRGFASTPLQPALFADTGRGLQALRGIKRGQLVLSLPESCLLTSSTVLHSYLGPYIKRWKPRLSPLVALCVFLVCERHLGEASDWFPYIDVLPAAYTCPAYFADDVLAVLPSGVRRRALEQREAVREIHSSHRTFFRSMQPILSRPADEVLTYEALRWAWCSVNTRSVFMSHPSNHFLCGQDVYALAPFLDLLNHRPDVQVEASFNDVTRCYEIRSACATPRYRQVFINYGSHDNQRLMLEYGFVAPCNPNSVVYVEAATSGRRCCSARCCVRRGRRGASGQPRLCVSGFFKTPTQLWTRYPVSSNGATSRSGSSSMWSSPCERRRGASWEAVWRRWKARRDKWANCCHANPVWTTRDDIRLVSPRHTMYQGVFFLPEAAMNEDTSLGKGEWPHCDFVKCTSSLFLLED
ncbi:SET domain-containing protein 4 isoform 3-T4 [Spinachia spinachia]